MKKMKIKNIIDRSEYNFIRENHHLKSNIILLALGGSYAYGLNQKNSDIDLRGFAFNKPNEIIGRTPDFEQVVDTNTDTTVYSLKKMIELLVSNNPNCLEIIGCKPEHYLIFNQIGQQLIDNKKLFISQKSIYTFGGYSNAQLRRLQASLARDYPQSEKEQHIMQSINHAMVDFHRRYEDFDNGAIKLYIDKSRNEDLENEIFIDVNLKHYPLRDYKNMQSDMNNIVKDYQKLTGRNKKKDDLHLNKHIQHLFRLNLMLFDILEKEELNTYRENDKDFLLQIRNGLFMDEEKRQLNQGFYDLLNEHEKRLEYAKKHTCLQLEPDYVKIEEILMDANEYIVNKDKEIYMTIY
jgi:predicted nucleotidyltransferase